uniref:Uncharacterized protein n=1 Tax=Acrobeloides nanus TaxID=290746 RepID=A0A914CWB7_9BILA
MNVMMRVRMLDIPSLYYVSTRYQYNKPPNSRVPRFIRRFLMLYPVNYESVLKCVLVVTAAFPFARMLYKKFTASPEELEEIDKRVQAFRHQDHPRR